jgi:hypothetical protein
MHDLEETMEWMFCLPTALRLKGPVSLAKLAEDTGYLGHRQAIDVARLQAAIRNRQGLIDSWLDYSAEKSADWGWFFEGPNRGRYLVGSRKYSIEGSRQLADASEACAHFIKGEFDALLGKEAPVGRGTGSGPAADPPKALIVQGRMGD